MVIVVQVRDSRWRSTSPQHLTFPTAPGSPAEHEAIVSLPVRAIALVDGAHAPD
jgi:hypothetical protein